MELNEVPLKMKKRPSMAGFLRANYYLYECFSSSFFCLAMMMPVLDSRLGRCAKGTFVTSSIGINSFKWGRQCKSTFRVFKFGGPVIIDVGFPQLRQPCIVCNRLCFLLFLLSLLAAVETCTATIKNLLKFSLRCLWAWPCWYALYLFYFFMLASFQLIVSR